MESRKRKRSQIAIGTTGVAAFGIWFFLFRTNEPAYDGKPLSEWIDIAAPRQRRINTTDEQAEAAKAIRAIGTNGLPQLVEWVGYTPGGLVLTILRYYPKLPVWLRQSPRIFRFIYKPFMRADGAVKAFGVLGPDAVPAIPNLTRLVQSTNHSPETRQRALSALAHIGPQAVPAMIGVVSNLSQPSDLWILAPLGRLDTNIVPMMPALVSQIQNTNLAVASGIVQFLGDLLQYPELAVPALKDCLEDSRPQIRSEAAHGLGRFSGRAKPALPALVKALRDPDDQVRAAATAAINSIYPPAIKWPIQE